MATLTFQSMNNGHATGSNSVTCDPPYVIFKNDARDATGVVYLTHKSNTPTDTIRNLESYVLSPGEVLRLDISEQQTFYVNSISPSGVADGSRVYVAFFHPAA